MSLFGVTSVLIGRAIVVGEGTGIFLECLRDGTMKIILTKNCYRTSDMRRVSHAPKLRRRWFQQRRPQSRRIFP